MKRTLQLEIAAKKMKKALFKRRSRISQQLKNNKIKAIRIELAKQPKKRDISQKSKDYHDNQSRFRHDKLNKINDFLDKQARVRSPEPIPDEEYSNALDIMLFLWNCTPDMENWFQPLITFGCDRLSYLKIIAQWDETSMEDIFRRIMAQPDGMRLKETDLIFLLRNLKKIL